MSQVGTISSVPGTDGAELYAINTGNLVATASSVVADNDDPSFFTITFSGVAVGSYRLVLRDGGIVNAVEPVVNVSASSWAVRDSSGYGARTVVITVTLDGNPLESANVRLTKGAESYTISTNVNGQCTFNVDDGTWTVAITAPNTTFAGASLVVDGDESQTYTMTALSVVPSPTIPDTCRVQLIASRNVAVEKVRVLIHSEGSAGRSGNNAFLNRAFDGETNASGLLLVDLPWSSIAGVGRYRFKLFDLATGSLLHDRTCTVPDLVSAEYDELTT